MVTLVKFFVYTVLTFLGLFVVCIWIPLMGVWAVAKVCGHFAL